MENIEKIIKNMKKQPKGITFTEIKKVLKHNGYRVVRVAGSHHQFRNEQGLLTTIKRENPSCGGCTKQNRGVSFPSVFPFYLKT